MSTDDPLSQGVVFEMLHSPRRRYVLDYLCDHEGPVELDDLIAQVAARENDTVVDAVSETERKRIYVSLHQSHLPKLADSGLVEYDEDSGTVELAERAADVDRYISEVSGRGRSRPRWHYAYLVLSALGAAALLATWIGVPGFSAVGTTTTGSLVVGAFVALTGVVYAASVETHSPESLRFPGGQ